MRKNLLGKLILIAMLVTMALGASITRAQDPSPEEVLDRLSNALERTDTYESFVGTFSEVQSQAVSINIGGFAQEQLSNTAREGEVRIIRGDNPNAVGFMTVRVLESEGADELAYTVEAEVRLVDGTIFVNASYIDGENPSFPLTGEWEAVDMEQQFMFPQYDILDLPGLGELVTPDMDDVEGEEDMDDEDEGSPFDQLAEIIANASDISVEQVEQDGDTIDLYTLTFGMDALMQVMGAEGLGDESNPVIPIILEELGGIEDLINMSIGLDAEDNVRQMSMDMVVDIVDVDASQLDPNIPTGSTFSFSIGMLQSRTFDQINQVTERVEAPE
jgi:hypothetical protein